MGAGRAWLIGGAVEMTESVKHRQHTSIKDADGFAGEPVIQITIASRPDRLRLVRAVVTEAALSCGCGKKCVHDIVIAVDEACQNVIQHAYGGDPDQKILIDIRRDGESIAFNIIDYATPVDVSKVKPRSLDDLRPGGLGTHFISACMDDARFRSPPEGAGNRLWMVKRIK